MPNGIHRAWVCNFAIMQHSKLIKQDTLQLGPGAQALADCMPLSSIWRHGPLCKPFSTSLVQ